MILKPPFKPMAPDALPQQRLHEVVELETWSFTFEPSVSEGPGDLDAGAALPRWSATAQVVDEVMSRVALGELAP